LIICFCGAKDFLGSMNCHVCLHNRNTFRGPETITFLWNFSGE